MSDRETEIRDVAATLREDDAVANAFLAKSFTDRLLVVDLHGGREIAGEHAELLATHGLVGANEVYAEGDDGASIAGAVGETTRHQFVDVQTRGDHQSYVVD